MSRTTISVDEDVKQALAADKGGDASWNAYLKGLVDQDAGTDRPERAIDADALRNAAEDADIATKGDLADLRADIERDIESAFQNLRP